MRVPLLLQLVPLLVGPSLAAPRTGSRSEESQEPGISNPFVPGADNLRLLQEYLKEMDPLKETTSMKRETAILHLFLLHDFDKSGFLDGLELMRLLSGIFRIHIQKDSDQKWVVFLVDEALEKQDLNFDGLLSAQELITAPVYKEDSAQSVHEVIPPPPAPPIGDLPTDNDTNIEILKELESFDQHTQNGEVNQDQPQINELEEVVGSHEEARVEDNEDETEDVQEPGEEETLDTAVDNEM